jgi:hypothetical protein
LGLACAGAVWGATAIAASDPNPKMYAAVRQSSWFSVVRMDLWGYNAFVHDERGNVIPPPAWSVQTRRGRVVASGKFEYG